jgi:hypothetical protein
MTMDSADAAARRLIGFWRQEEMDAKTRQLCSRIDAAMDPVVRGELRLAVRTNQQASTPRVAEALRGAAESDPSLRGLLRELAPGDDAEQDRGGPRQSIHVEGNANEVNVAGRDLLLGFLPRRGSKGDRESPAAILVASADAVDLDPLRVGEEAREIRDAIRAGKQRERWEVHPWTSVRLRDLTQGLLELEPRILHFSGHGGAGGLILEDEIGCARQLSPEALSSIFRALPFKVECVVLNACYSEPQARAICAHVRYVIGTTGQLPDRSAIGFAFGFYQALAAGVAIPQAYDMGCAHWHGENIPGYELPKLIECGSSADRL